MGWEAQNDECTSYAILLQLFLFAIWGPRAEHSNTQRHLSIIAVVGKSIDVLLGYRDKCYAINPIIGFQPKNAWKKKSAGKALDGGPEKLECRSFWT